MLWMVVWTCSVVLVVEETTKRREDNLRRGFSSLSCQSDIVLHLFCAALNNRHSILIL